MTYQQRIGKIGEQIAADYLADNGYQVLDRNFKVRYGEIDLVALEGDRGLCGG
jgi:putative endonuclease